MVQTAPNPNHAGTPAPLTTEAAPSAAEGSRLYLKYILPDDSDGGLHRQVWAGTPWIADVFTGSHGRPDDRWRPINEWCFERYGDQAFPFGNNPSPGRWRSGGATVFGWTWFGFSTEAEMQEFEAAWPAPLGNIDASKIASSRSLPDGELGPGRNYENGGDQ